MSNGQENTKISSSENAIDESFNKSVTKRSSPLLITQNKFKRKKQKRIEWTQEELDELEEGMIKFGTNWTLILKMKNEEEKEKESHLEFFKRPQDKYLKKVNLVGELILARYEDLT
ncbi:hypothetical protein GLOIN_2v1588525 [Rhizophagus clarus]|uniref:Myb-like domain-containing protein n=1 Tax=Rhizophagus clarus TaxID=94130 RepID=A0A8H3QP31_9GLOM|nr:hypothetical protein GLOIN_2v1588525 [Rhizophagus clarus]